VRDHISDERVDRSAFAFRLDLDAVAGGIANEAVNRVMACDLPDGLTKENALDEPANGDAAAFANFARRE
jgi:hypothetical protein